ncbi:MAG: hypothetical protein M5U08_12300 [Burkholderiales bacterium]|nr:hypothetical protein [Burkholderiales bacterium]
MLYVDIDAHHCDGVEATFRDDPETLTLSLHMDTAYAYPGCGGRLEDTGSAAGGHTTLNVPLPRALTDAEYRLVFDAVWPGALARFRPDAIVLQAGTDMLAGDPLGRWRCATQTFLAVCERIVESAPRHADGTPRVLATGGGGYHPLLVARAWAGLWGVLSGRALPETLPAAGAALLRGVDWERDADDDDAFYQSLLRARVEPATTETVREEVRALAARALEHPLLAAAALSG